MREIPTIAKWIMGTAGGLLLTLGLLLFTSPGLGLVGSLVRPLTGGDVTVEGLGGSSPNHIRADAVIISDTQGPWLRIEKVALDWSALALLRNHIAVRDVAATRVVLLRRPVPSGRQSEPTLFDIDRLSLPRVEIASPVIGRPVTLGASGAVHYLSLGQFTADLLVSRRNSRDLYRIVGGIEQDIARGDVTIREGDDGILAELLEMPGLGPLNVSARASGTRDANAMSFTLSAGPLRAHGGGTIALATSRARLEFTATAPAMAPRPDMGWQSLSANGRFDGTFDAPVIHANLALSGAAFAGFGAKQLTADVSGDGGRAGLRGVITSLTVPGGDPGIFAGAPLTFDAQANLRPASRPVTFRLQHPLVSLTGNAHTRGQMNGAAQLSVPSLSAFKALQAAGLRGAASARLSLSQSGRQLKLALNGKLDTRGTTIAARLLGRAATLKAHVVAEGADIVDSSLRLDGAALGTEVNGHVRKGVLNYRLALDLSDLSRLALAVQGSLTLRGNANGPLAHADLSASGNAVLGTKGFARQRVAIELSATGLPSPRDGKLSMTGRLNGAPLAIQASLAEGAPRRAKLTARWKSLDAKADIAIPDRNGLSGQASLTLARLADIAVFTGKQVTGALRGNAILRTRGAKTDAAVKLALQSVRLDAMGAEDASAQGNIADLFGKPALNGDLALRGLAAFGFGGDVATHVSGPLDRLSITLDSRLKDGSGVPVVLTAAGLLDMPRQHFTVSALKGDWRGIAASLDSPATLDISNGGLAVDTLAAHLGGGTVTAHGRILPRLALNVLARDIALDNFGNFAPGMGLQGTLSARAALTGSFAAPHGSVTLEGRGLRTAFSGRSIPPATIDADFLLQGDGATVTASLVAGTAVRLDIKGEAPLAADRLMALHTSGTTDLALLDPFLASAGRRLRGLLTLDADIGGTRSAPRVSGTGKLAGGEIQDYALGARVQNIEAVLEADGTRITVTSLTGRAGPGSITGNGSLDLDMPGMLVDFRFNALNARPVVSDLFTANLSGDVRVAGPLRDLAVSGTLRIPRGEINLPDNFPPEVAVLNVRRRSRALPPPSQSRVALDLGVRTSGPIFVRGRGVDAEMGGEIKVGGTIAAPVISGDFRMNRGSYDFAGQRLDFTSGRIGFDGTGVRGRLDPALDFVAQTVSGGVTATLQVGGYASQPRITLSSTPQLPQDEVVAHLLFQQSVKQLSPLQLASLAQGVAALGGIGIGGSGAGGFNPLGTLRRTVGLDRLSVGSVEGATPGESQTTVEAGRYISSNVYVGVKQNLSGGTRTQVQVDLTRHLKAQATVSAGTDASATQGSTLQDNGSSVGLSYQFEY